MELVMFVFLGVFMLAAFYFGIKAGRGEDIDLTMGGFKPIVRTDEQTEKLVDKLRAK